MSTDTFLTLTTSNLSLTHPDWPNYSIRFNNYATPSLVDLSTGHHSDISSDLMIPLYNYISSLSDSSHLSFDTGLMPPGVLYVDSNLVIFERPPTYENVQIIPSLMNDIVYEKSTTHLYRLPIPWTVYFVSYSIFNGIYYPNQVNMYFSSSSLQGADLDSTVLYLSPLVNFYNDSSLCNPMFESMEEHTRYENNISGIVSAAYNWVWNTGSNIDLTTNIAEYFFQIRTRPSDFVDNPFSSLAPVIHATSFYIDFSYISLFYSKWEDISLQDVSSVTWPNPSFVQKIHSEITLTGSSRILDYFHYYDMNPDDYIAPLEYAEEHGEHYIYDEHKYLKYLRSTYSQPKSFNQLLNHFISSSNSLPSSSTSFSKIISDIFLSSLSS